MRRVCVVQFFTWLAYFTFFIYMQGWMTQIVFKGKTKANGGTPAEAERFVEGSSAGSLGLALQAVVTFIFAAILVRVLRFQTINRQL
jgi:hypothetical protein